MHKFLDAAKALESVVYVSHNTSNLFNLVKTLYYADKFHLERYGRTISGDHYIAMDDGPVPSGAYDLIKLARGDKFAYDEKIVEVHAEDAIRTERDGSNTLVFPRRGPHFDMLSESDIECLDEAIEKYGNMNTSRLWKIVHMEKAFSETDQDKPIPLRKIISLDIPNGQEVLEYLDS